MNDIKQGYRDTKNEVKEQVRKIDGDSPADAVGNLGDDVRDTLGTAADDLGEAMDRPNASDPTKR